MIFNDGQAFMNPEGDMRAQNVMDNLIYRREIPGDDRRVHQSRPHVPSSPSRPAGLGRPRPRTVRPNTTRLDDKYARVIVDELLPVLYKDYNISKDPERHGIGGSSSGAIAAFTVAWERPNQFRKVLSIVGSFTNMRGGHVYPEIVRKSEKKPIRVFLSDGRNDNRGAARRRNLRPESRLVLPERPPAAGAHGEGLRRELLVGHQSPRPEDAAEPSSRK